MKKVLSVNEGFIEILSNRGDCSRVSGYFGVESRVLAEHILLVCGYELGLAIRLMSRVRGILNEIQAARFSSNCRGG